MIGPNAPQEVKDAWMEAAKEVNANGLGIKKNGMLSHISQMLSLIHIFNYTTVSKSGTITINDFNGFDPSGKWKRWIVTKGTVSTSTETIKVYYTY